MARYSTGHDGLRPKTQFTVQFYDKENKEFIWTPTTRVFITLGDGQQFDIVANERKLGGLMTRGNGSSSIMSLQDGKAVLLSEMEAEDAQSTGD